MKQHQTEDASLTEGGPAEGVIKFVSAHTQSKLFFPPELRKELQELLFWRNQMFHLGFIGCDLSRYGACYGNASIRYLIPGTTAYAFEKAPGYRTFVITATQTGNLEQLSEQHLARVYHYDHQRNKVWSEGLLPPSSETMTHGALYDLPLESNVRVVFHLHAPALWENAARLGLPQTGENIEYGTPEMAWEVQRLFQQESLKNKKIFAMPGHKDGIICFGSTPKEAAAVLEQYTRRLC